MKKVKVNITNQNGDWIAQVKKPSHLVSFVRHKDPSIFYDLVARELNAKFEKSKGFEAKFVPELSPELFLEAATETNLEGAEFFWKKM